MSDYANELRLIAAEAIRKLWIMGETSQLKLLEAQATSSLMKPCPDKLNDES